MKRETKIGLFTLVAIFVAIFGFKFLKGQDVFGRSDTLYATYDNVDYLTPSNPVMLNGFQVGIVTEILQNPANIAQFDVFFSLNEGIHLPKNTVAVIKTTGLMGGKAIELEFTGSCEGSNCAQDGDKLKGITLNMISSMVAEDDIEGYMKIIADGLNDVLAKLSDPNSKAYASYAKLDSTLTNMQSISASLDRELKYKNSNFNQTLGNVNTLTGESLPQLLSRFDSVAQDVDKANIDELAQNANARIKELEGTLDNLDKTLASLDGTLGKINSGEGTLGKLIQEDEVYNNLNSSLKNLDLLLEDFRVHPKRYTRFLSKKEIPYEDKGND